MRLNRFYEASRVLAACLLSVAAIGAATQARAQAPAELFLSEYIEGSSNNKALEIYNGTGTAINLAAGGYNVQMYFNGSTTPGLTINLTGTVANGDVFVLAHSSASAAILAQADQTNGSGWCNGDDAVVLRKGSTVIDVIGQIGYDPGTEWGSGLTSTADNTLRRKATILSGDTNGSDVFDPSVEWEGFATDTFSGLGGHAVTLPQVDSAPTVASTYPANGAADVPVGADLSVTFSEPVNVAANWFTLSCNSAPVSASVSGGPTTFTINPSADLPDAGSCRLTVVAAAVSDQDADDPPDTMATDLTLQFTAKDRCADPYTPIYAIQGSGASVALTGTQTTMGVVVGDYEGPSPALRGFFIQDPTGDGDPATSDGIFLFEGSNANTVSIGDRVRVTGTAGENQGQSQISVGTIIKCGTGTVAPADVTFPVPSADYLERFEGMLVRLPQTMSVTEHFQLGRFGQIVLSTGGRLSQPTDIVSPGPAAQAVYAANSLNRIIVDDASQAQNPDPIVFARGGRPLSAGNTLRGGDTVTGLVGVLNYTWAGNSASGNAYRIRPVNAMSGGAFFEPVNPRPSVAPAVGGSLRIAGANVLNYYNTFSECRDGLTGELDNCRGASDAVEFERQAAKTVAELLATQADVIGLIEIENDGYGPASAIQDLVNRLNLASAPGTWAFVDADAGTGMIDVLGTDGIKVGLIYKVDRTAPVGRTAVIRSGAFGPFILSDGRVQERNRPSLAQTFQAKGNGALVTVVVNHLISKGASCELNVSPVGPDPDTGDGQGACNQTRVAAMEELMAWLGTDPTGVGDADYLLLGDFNAYSQEDPITMLAAGGYVDLVPNFGGPGTYSYAFDGQWGSLDHAVSSPSLLGQVSGAASFHINADEPSVLDYTTDFKSSGQLANLYAPDMYRSSDHDPLVVGLTLNAAPVVSAGGPYTVYEGERVQLQAAGHDPDGGPVTYAWDLDNNGTFESQGQSAVFHASDGIGVYPVQVRATDQGGLSAVARTTVTVLYKWTGFFAPVENQPAWNKAQPGNAIPIKFSLGGDKGLDIFATGFPVSMQVDCATGAVAADSSPTANPGSSGLSRDTATGKYLYVWKTEKSWKGTCRTLVVRLIDGSIHQALFGFR
jgi:uncharacterized protein